MKVETDRLYYLDCYLTAFDAQIVESADAGRRVYLDRTAFYPTSGGQPNDTGTLGGVAVQDVIDENDRIAHVLALPLSTGPVQGRIDWARRYDHMQQHTGQHLLSAVFVELLGARTLSFHLGAATSTIELELKELSDSQSDAVEERVNEIVHQAHPVAIRFEEADHVQYLRKASSRTGTLRIVEIEAVDRSACGGTHVRSTVELGPIQIRKSEKIRGNIRVEFVCGGRARRRARQDFRLLSELSKQAAVPPDRLPEHIAALRERLTVAEKSVQRNALELARHEGESLYNTTAPSDDGVRRALLRADLIDDAVRAKAQAFAAKPTAIALVLGSERGAILIAASADSGVNAGALMKETFARRGGRGGGSAVLAQGSVPDAAVTEELIGALGFSA